MKQLELFPEMNFKENEFETIKQEWTKTRKALFRELSQTRQLYQELAHEFQLLKMSICKGRIPI